MRPKKDLANTMPPALGWSFKKLHTAFGERLRSAATAKRRAEPDFENVLGASVKEVVDLVYLLRRNYRILNEDESKQIKEDEQQLGRFVIALDELLKACAVMPRRPQISLFRHNHPLYTNPPPVPTLEFKEFVDLLRQVKKIVQPKQLELAPRRGRPSIHTALNKFVRRLIDLWELTTGRRVTRSVKPTEQGMPTFGNFCWWLIEKFYNSGSPSGDVVALMTFEVLLRKAIESRRVNS